LKRWQWLCLTAELLLIALLLGVFVWKGELHVDEASYIYAAQEIIRGKMPFHDFFFLQPPLFPYVLSIPMFFTSGDFLLCRSFMALFGFASIILTVILGFRFAGPTGALLAAYFFIITPFQLQFYSIARMYPLAAFLICAGFIFMYPDRRSVFLRSCAMAFFVLAVGTRFTLILLPSLYGLYLLLTDNWRSRQVIIPLVAGLGVFLYVFLPFLIPDPDRFYFNVFGYHLDISLGSYKASIIHKTAGIARLLKVYFFTFLFAAFSFICYRQYLRHRTDELFARQRRFLFFLLSVVLVVGAGHFAAKFFQESYQSVLFPAFILMIIYVISSLIEQIHSRRAGVFLFLCFVLAIPVSFFASGRPGLVMKPGLRDIEAARKIAGYLEARTTPDALIATGDTALIPLLAHRRVMHGFEGIEYYPRMSEKRAAQIGVINHEMMKTIIREERADAFIINSQSFNLDMGNRMPIEPHYRQEILDLLEKHYRKLRSFPHVFTQEAFTDIYFPRSKPAYN